MFTRLQLPGCYDPTKFLRSQSSGVLISVSQQPMCFLDSHSHPSFSTGGINIGIPDESARDYRSLRRGNYDIELDNVFAFLDLNASRIPRRYFPTLHEHSRQAQQVEIESLVEADVSETCPHSRTPIFFQEPSWYVDGRRCFDCWSSMPNTCARSFFLVSRTFLRFRGVT